MRPAGGRWWLNSVPFVDTKYFASMFGRSQAGSAGGRAAYRRNSLRHLREVRLVADAERVGNGDVDLVAPLLHGHAREVLLQRRDARAHRGQHLAALAGGCAGTT